MAVSAAPHRPPPERIADPRKPSPADDHEGSSEPGLRKVYKAEFERDPERYVLRQGFPDAPPCPFGGVFSILGFDTVEQTYVWLVRSIIRDPRLTRIPYNGEAT